MREDFSYHSSLITHHSNGVSYEQKIFLEIKWCGAGECRNGDGGAIVLAACGDGADEGSSDGWPSQSLDRNLSTRRSGWPQCGRATRRERVLRSASDAGDSETEGRGRFGGSG